jgi:hypothetical protein
VYSGIENGLFGLIPLGMGAGLLAAASVARKNSN